MFDAIPETRPLTPLLDSIERPENLRHLEPQQLDELAEQLRAYLLYSVGQSGGHFGAGLGVVELAIALHFALNTPVDDLIWDVGHQAYPHKILTGRREAMTTIRNEGGLAPFPSRSESEYDAFGVGHASTSISAALGMSLAKQHIGDDSHTVAVLGDGAMTAGMAYEALNHAAHTHANMLIVLNDNSMSISPNVGGLSNYLSNLVSYRRARLKTEPPLLTPATIFEDLGLKYCGPEDGHDIASLINHINTLVAQPGVKLLHVKTEKGRGFEPAKNDPLKYHALTKIEAKQESKASSLKYQDVFGQWICNTAETDTTLHAITPAMRDGSGMNDFAKRFPERFYDVAIAEQHAVTFAAGLACKGLKPVVAIYSTFLQRAYDQLIHDVALQNLDVTFAVDRAGLVGGDGATHHGAFDLSFLRCIPNLIIATPSDENECYQLLSAAYQHKGPAAVRYPRGSGPGAPISNTPQLEIGLSRMIREGENLCFLSFGTLLEQILPLADELNTGVCDMRWVKPLDEERIRALAESYDAFVICEENTQLGGAASGVLEYIHNNDIQINTLTLALPDSFIEHGSRNDTLRKAGLDCHQLRQSVLSFISKSN